MYRTIARLTIFVKWFVKDVAKYCELYGFIVYSLIFFMLHERYQDRVKVSVVFDGNIVTPKAMKWGNNVYHLSRVLNVHSTNNGREQLHIFSVATDTDFFRLELRTEKLEWFLVDHYQD
jgi:hypothetical protein